MTLEQLRIFVVVAEHEHVTRASYALDMVQSAVSKAIATLENELAILLFDRVGRNIRLTPRGAAFRLKAIELLDHADLLRAWTIEVRDEPIAWRARAVAKLVSAKSLRVGSATARGRGGKSDDACCDAVASPRTDLEAR